MDLLNQLKQGSLRALARSISCVENESEGYESILQGIQPNLDIPIVGITGPPGAGKSSLVAALTKTYVHEGKKVAVLAIDPSSPFNHGAIMGDRVRMNEHFLAPGVFIRSMASRGSLGGLAPKVFEITELLRGANFDIILIETVGVGQSEVEIAALADTTLLVLVPEAGDEIQTIKSGIMEIADVFVLNKSDRDHADALYTSLKTLAHSHERNDWESPVIKTIAIRNEGITELTEAIAQHHLHGSDREHRLQLLTDKAMVFIRNMRTRDILPDALKADLRTHLNDKNFNLFQYVKQYSSSLKN